jgi:nucleotide-binding universal stress UspA family protein
MNYAAEADVDLIVLGTHGRRGPSRILLESVAEEVVQKAPSPIVTVGRGAVAPEAMEGGTMLVPVDFSEHRARLLAHAREIASVYGMDVTVLHVVEVTGVPDAYGVYSSLPDAGKLGDRAQEVLDEEVESLRAEGIDVSIMAESGQPAERVLAVAEEKEAAFVMIATHGRTGLERMLMGSVAEEVIRQAPCPVCTVKSSGQSLVAENGGDEDVSS